MPRAGAERHGDRGRAGPRAARAAALARRPAHADDHAASAARGARRARRRVARTRAAGEDIARDLAEAAAQATTLVDIARTLASERGDDARRRDAVLGARRTRSARSRVIGARPGAVAQPTRATSKLRTRRARERRRARWPTAMEFGFLLDPRAQAALDRLSRGRGHARPELLRPARLRGAPGELRRHRQGRCRRRGTGSGSAARVTPVGRGAALISWSGSMFEYLMPSLVMRAPAGSLLEQTSRLIVRRQIAYGADARRALGHLGIRLQRARPRAHLPVLELRRARPRPEARPERERRHRALCDGARGDGRSAARRRAISRAWPPSARAAATASTKRSTTRRTRLPEGEDVAIVRAYMAHHQGMTIVAIANALLDGSDARALSRRADHPGDRAAAAGTHAARRRGGASARRGSRHGGDGARRSSCPTVRRLHTRARRHAANAPAVERPLRGDADRRRLRLQPLARPRGHALARGRHPRRLGHPTSSCATSRAARCGRRATSRAASSRTATRSRSPRIAPSSSGATARSRRRSRSSSRPRTTPRSAASRSRTRAAARARSSSPRMPSSCWRRRPPTRRIRPSPSCSCRPSIVAELGAHPRHAAAALARRAGGLGGASRGRRRRERSASREIETDRARFLGRGREVRAPIAVMDGRPLSNTVGTRARSDVRAAPAACGCRRARRRAIAFWTVVAPSRERGARPGRQASRRDRLRARGHAGLDAGAGAAAPSRHRCRTRRACSSGSPATCSTPIRRCGRRPTPSAAAAARRRRCGRTASPATCRSCWCASTTSRTSAIVRQLLRAHEYWRMKQLAVDLVILNERASSYVQDLQIALETLVRTSQSRPQIGADAARGSVFVLRADLDSGARRARCCSSRRARGAGRPARQPGRAARPPAGSRQLRPRRRRRRTPRAHASRSRSRRRRISSSSTASAASPRTGANT